VSYDTVGYKPQDGEIKYSEPRSASRKNHTIDDYLQNSTSRPDIDIEVEKVAIEDLRAAPYKAMVDFYGIAYSLVPNELIQVNPLGLAVTYFREDEAFK
jgi:hypothetical protein